MNDSCWDEASDLLTPNSLAKQRWQLLADNLRSHRIEKQTIHGATVLDFGVHAKGSLEAGIALAEGCMGGLATVRVMPQADPALVAANAVTVNVDLPLLSCLGCQYAGWPVSHDKYFAMGSGPMRLLRGKEDVLSEYQLSDIDGCAEVAGVLESDDLPTDQIIEQVAAECQVRPEQLTLAVAPSTSIAGTVQVVARSVETAMHKLHDLKFDLNTVVSGSAIAPLPPPAKPGDSVAGIGRTNDAMLYGATVTLWVDCSDEAVESVVQQTPSCSSKDYGQPFAKIFADYKYDFYQVDPALFSPAVVHFHNLATGKTFSAGKLNPEVMRESFGMNS